MNDPNQEVVPSDFRFTLIGGGSNVQSQGFPPPECLNSPTSIVGEYSVSEDRVGSDAPPPDVVEVKGDCIQDPTNPLRATGEVEEGGTEVCTFINTYELEEESTTLSGCKEMGDSSLFFEPNDFTFTVTGNGPIPAQFVGDNSDGCVDVSIGPGEYAVSEVNNSGGGSLVRVIIEDDCVDEDPADVDSSIATGEIDAGETQECTFINTISD